MQKQKLIIILFILISISCARVVQPPGGPADKSAPVVIENSPANFNTRFNSNKVVLKFDEFVVLKSFNEEFVASPLFVDKPEKLLKGKSLILKFNKDSLIPNTTYTLDFGNSIVDFREGNQLAPFQYVFSTGDYLDSLFISGHLYLAEDLSPQEKVWVMLYKDYNDTILTYQKPDFIAKTDIDGFYSINNIAPGNYSMFALKDINNNFIFDLPNEQIAFLDSIFVLKIEEHIHDKDCENPDSLANELDSIKKNIDSTFQITDSTSVILDSLSLKHSHYVIYPEALDLFLFEEIFINNYLNDFSRPKSHILNLTFSEPQDSTILFSIESARKEQWTIEPSEYRDTFNIWILDTALANNDSLKMFLDYYKTDTNLNLVRTLDTLAFNFKKKASFKTKKQKREEVKDSVASVKEYLNITANFIKQNPFDLYKYPEFTLDFPIDSVDLSKINFYEKVDTNFVRREVLAERDSVHQRTFRIKESLNEETEYKVYIEPNTFIDYRGLFNDTLDHIFTTTGLDKYTEILLDLKSINQRQIIFQLFNDSERKIDERIVTEDSQLRFEYLNPSKYQFKIIFDNNRNGIWDTGDYLLKKQAEEVRYYDELIETKANWSHDIIWDLEEKKEPEGEEETL